MGNDSLFSLKINDSKIKILQLTINRREIEPRFL